jgi:hypothetical protein
VRAPQNDEHLIRKQRKQREYHQDGRDRFGGARQRAGFSVLGERGPTCSSCTRAAASSPSATFCIVIVYNIQARLRRMSPSLERLPPTSVQWGGGRFAISPS